ncbi:hypothetical protein [Erythrobacter sp.]|uniref:hypothetical protein n=1 Tax=Erythrobacter sp. TaxID=1042 RepID=UPI00311EC546
MEFQEPDAQRHWRYYRLRVALILGALPRLDRHEIITDLEAHVADRMAHCTAPTEMGRLREALSQLGEPRDYLGPLVEPMLERHHGVARLLGRILAPLLPARRMIDETVMLAGNMLALALGVVVLVLGVGGVLAPSRFGIFRLGPDEFLVSFLGRIVPGATNALPWPAYLVMAAAALVMTIGVAKGLRRRIASAYFRLTERR